MARKKRSDRNQVIYSLTCSVTQEKYIGLTVARGRKYKYSAKLRLIAHVRNATIYGKDTILYRAMRQHGPTSFKLEVLEVVRGKAEGHRRELVLIQEHMATLNMVGGI